MSKLKPLAISVALVNAGAALPAISQVEEEVIVTGIRASLTSATEIKREAAGVTDAISAEDIGKFPDTNLAESLQRITGVSIDRTNGEGNQISVRGFGPSFNMVVLNGRQMPGASSPKQENADSQLQPRTFNFAEISADAVSGVEVYKTNKVNLPSGGIGATVNVKTARPLEMSSDFTLAGSVKAQMDTSNEVGEDITPELTAIVGKNFEFGDGVEFGILFNGSYSERDSRESIVTSDGWLRNNITDGDGCGYCPGGRVDTTNVDPSVNPGVIFTPRNLVTDNSDHERVRTNGQLVAQVGFAEKVTVTADYTLSTYEDDIRRAQTAVWFDQNLVQGTANANGTVTNPSITSDLVNFGAFDFNNYTDEVKTENESVGINVDFQVTDTLNLNFDYHDSESHAQPDGQSSDFLTIVSGPIGTSYSADYSTGSDVPILSYTGDVNPYDLTALRPNITLGRGNRMLNEIDEWNVRGLWENASDSALKSIGFGIGQTEYAVETEFTFDLTGIQRCLHFS